MSNFIATFGCGTSVPFEFVKYPDGTENLKLDEDRFVELYKQHSGNVRINWKFKDHGRDMFRLSMISRYLCWDLPYQDNAYFTLAVDYLPHARADRKFEGYAVNPLEVFCNYLDTLGFDKIVVDDVHNEEAIIEFLYTDFENYIETKAYLVNDDAIYVAPDKGAKARLKDNLRHLKHSCSTDSRVLVCNKERTDEGVSQTLPIYYEDMVKGKTCFIIDDICDGGRTFIGLSEKLKQAGAANVTLVVTHGIFSQGLEPFVGKVDTIKVRNCVGNINQEHIRKFNNKEEQ